MTHLSNPFNVGIYVSLAVMAFGFTLILIGRSLEAPPQTFTLTKQPSYCIMKGPHENQPLFLPCNKVEPRLYPNSWMDSGADI